MAGADLDFDPARLEPYLKAQLRELSGPMTTERIGGGQSNPTYRLRFGERAVVLRKQPTGELLPSAHAVDREHRVMAALAQTGVPVPEMLHLCIDRSVIGTLFYVMEALDGRVVHDCSIPGVSPLERAAMYDSMNDVLARLHQVDWQAVGLADFGRPGNYFARQISRWTRQWHASKTREIPEIDELIAWLPANLPAGDDETAIVHGDFRLGNLMFHLREPRVIAILDWELSTLGHPLADLAHNCLLWHATRAMYYGVEDLDQAALGIPAEADYVRRYCERTGRRDAVTAFHLALAMFRFAVIFEGIAQRARIGTAAAANAEQVGRLSVAYAERAYALIR
ncbi:MAG TPA: phosphotransferase family protein [Geminicoccaceae bacterium]|nr:phosphotransferase family protein [Geminicoccaceae bacterium]